MPEVIKTVGRYEILREVGRGGMAVVYQARQRHPTRYVALKEMRAIQDNDPSWAQRFLREADLAGSFSHQNIVTVHDYFEFEGTPYIAMEYVERGSLRPYVGHMSFAQIAGVLEGLLAGLTHAESRGVVHRDLKPENLMVTSDGRVKIADFGIAKATTKMQTGAFVTATGTTVGTPTYMAPEQAMAQDIGPWTDLYSVGCMAFEFFTGRVPFHDSDAPMAILLRHVNERIPPLTSVDASIDPGISDWVERLLVKDPAQRTQSASDAWDDFEEIVIGQLGPRWRRSARLLERATQDDAPTPLTPAPFEGPTADAPASEEFKSFAWGDAGTSETRGEAPAAPGPYTPPPHDLPPGPLVAAEANPSVFGAPAPPLPTDALVTPSSPGSEPSETEPAAFETYVEPPPRRPPTGNPDRTESAGAPRTEAHSEDAGVAPTLAPTPARAGEIPTSGAVASSSALPAAGSEGSHRHRHGMRLAWLAAAFVVVAVAAVVALLGRSGGPPSVPPAGRQADRALEVRAPSYRLTLPSGWSVHCRDAARVCAGQRLTDGVRRSAFVLGTGSDAVRMTIDRTRLGGAASGATGASIMSDVVAKLGALPGFRARSASRRTDVGNRPGRELAFTSDSSLFPAGIVDTVFTHGNAVVIISTGPTGARARAATRPVIETLRF